MGLKQELFPGIPLQVFPWIKSPNFGNEVEKTGMISKNSLQTQILHLLFPTQIHEGTSLFLKIRLPKAQHSQTSPSQQIEKQEKSILESQKMGKNLHKIPTVLPNFSIPPPKSKGGILGRAGPAVPWLCPEENPGILLIQISGIS